jgi:ribosome-dependent ATPase
MRCDRISLMNAGKVLACDAPQKLIEDRGARTLEEAFIGYMEDAIAAAKKPAPAHSSTSAAPIASPQASGAIEAPRSAQSSATTAAADAAAPTSAEAKAEVATIESSAAAHEAGASRGSAHLRRMLAYARNESMQIMRDPIRLMFAFLGSAVLMLVFGFGITTDVENIRYSSLDLDQSAESRAYLEQFASTARYFSRRPPLQSAEAALEALQADRVSLVLEMPPNFGRDVERLASPEVMAQIDGAMTFRADTIEQYVQGVHSELLQDPAVNWPVPKTKYGHPDIEQRFIYNPTFESVYSIVPSVPALLLLLIPAILMAVSIVREKELGSMINFYVTPTTRLEYLLGKQLPYVAIAMINFFILTVIAIAIFGVPVKGSFLVLTLCTLLYVIVTTCVGMLTSIFTSSQVAAVFVTAILTIVPTIQFSGLLQPVSTLQGSAAFIGSIWPASYYMHASVGAYTKGLSPALLVPDLIFLSICIPLLWLVSVIGLRKQER